MKSVASEEVNLTIFERMTSKVATVATLGTPWIAISGFAFVGASFIDCSLLVHMMTS